MAKDPEHYAHQEWIGFVQPVGLVVSVPALLAAQAQVNRHITPDHARFLSCLPRDKDDEIVPELRDLGEFTRTVLDWDEADLTPLPDDAALSEEFASLEVVLPEYHETLRPTHVVKEFKPAEDQPPWLLLVKQLSAGPDLDEPHAASDRNWHASPHAKFERLLRETNFPIGLLANGTHLRLIYAPRGETSGFMTFSVAEMAQVAGRPIFAALHMLLSAERLFSLPEKQRLPSILSESRKYQNTVSTKLAEQVLAALYELLRGFQSANDQRHGELLKEVLEDDPNHVYSGLLTVLMRLVFVLFAEDRSLTPSDSIYTNHYSVTGLFERLRAEAGRYPDTMDHRYGAWSGLLTLFRLVYEGGSHDEMQIPRRRGYLFDPDRYPFLEGRKPDSRLGDGEPVAIPRVSDGVVFRVLRNLLVLDGERLSYRTLDVEQIGSVYETIMGFNLEVAEGRSIAIKPAKSHGAPATINLEALLDTPAKDRAKWFKERTDRKLSGNTLKEVKEADSIESLLEALERLIAGHVTPNVVPSGAMVFQPSDERRRSGSHYTPRSLTEPIVRTTLKPILESLSEQPTPEQLLDLKVCDPAMGSGAFLVEACRQLGDELVKTWHVHDCVPMIPPDEDELLHARRLIAQRCLYGVDKNRMAVDLSKLSLWLATLAKDHPFTFLDHSLRAGDSLVGLSKEQIAAFHWKPPKKRSEDDVWFGDPIAAKMKTVTEYRQRILASRDDKPYEQLRQELDVADEALAIARFTGDLVIAAFFSAGKNRQRIETLNMLARQLVKYMGPQGKVEDRQPLGKAVDALCSGENPIEPFHWQIEFPEVFSRENSGFDCFVGNPPFLGGRRTTSVLGESYRDYLALAPKSSSNADLCSYFFRQAHLLNHRTGTLGLIATNTIAQGDTRSNGLSWICSNGGTIYSARRRVPWPGAAAVVVSVISIAKSDYRGPCMLDGNAVSKITAFLFHRGGHDDPVRLLANRGKSFQGSIPLGLGFTFDDTDVKGVATPISEMQRLIHDEPRNQQCIFPYIGGAEVNDSPRHLHDRFIISFGEMEEEQARQWPDLFAIVEAQVKPVRLKQKRKPLREKWWRHAETRPALYTAVKNLDRVLACAQTSKYRTVTFLPTGMIYDQKLIVFPFADCVSYALLQSQVHVHWARFFGSTLEDRPVYSPTDCFDPFPFPSEMSQLEQIGKECFTFRRDLMIAAELGLTDTYNRFHAPLEKSSEISHLRELHEAMDRAVLEAYGWDDLAETATCEFLLDYEEEHDDEPGAKKSKKKKPWRLRWPDEFRDEVLARLLELNKQRAEEERLAGIAAEAPAKKPKKKPRRKPRQETLALFQAEQEQFYIVMLLRAWENKPLNRHALDAGLILLLNDNLREALLNRSTRPTGKPHTVQGLDNVLTELAARDLVVIDNSGAQQILKIGPAAPTTDDAPEEDVTRLAGVKEYFAQQVASNKVTMSEEVVDAQQDLIPA